MYLMVYDALRDTPSPTEDGIDKNKAVCYLVYPMVYDALRDTPSPTAEGEGVGLQSPGNSQAEV